MLFIPLPFLPGHGEPGVHHEADGCQAYYGSEGQGHDNTQDRTQIQGPWIPCAIVQGMGLLCAQVSLNFLFTPGFIQLIFVEKYNNGMYLEFMVMHELLCIKENGHLSYVKAGPYTAFLEGGFKEQKTKQNRSSLLTSSRVTGWGWWQTNKKSKRGCLQFSSVQFNFIDPLKRKFVSFTL